MAAAPIAAQPRVQVRQRDTHVRPDARLGDRTARHVQVEQLVGRDGHLLAEPPLLVRRGAEDPVEDLGRQRHQVRMRDPRPVEPVAALALLVVADPGHGDLGHRRIAPVRDERRHPADRVRATPMARPDEQLRVGAHERHRHRQLRTIGHGSSPGRVRSFLMPLNR